MHAQEELTFIAGVHGNERIPVEVLTALGVPFILGNPRAYAQDVRFTERDLNASFGTGGLTYEEQRAQELRAELQGRSVVDFHTTTAVADPFVIITNMELLPLARRVGVERVVYMAHNFKSGHALIDYIPGISVEISSAEPAGCRQTVERVVQSIESDRVTPITLYEAYGVITEEGEYTNFVPHSSGFIPLFVGEVAYDFIGLKMRTLRLSEE